MIDLQLARVGKRYELRSDGNEPRRWYRNPFSHRSAEMWALRDVSFDVKRGEALGVVGHNGAGKTTILKLLSGITTPTRGEITIRGRLAALVEVGSGFHPELTGRENIYLHGAMLGMRRSEIARTMDSIIDFSGVAEFIDTPVKRYSSGMYVRLGFSIVAHLDPDILLLDEVLAVGDVAFQAKCIDRIAELRKKRLHHYLCLARSRGCVSSLRSGAVAQSRTACYGRCSAAGNRPLPADGLSQPSTRFR